MDQVVGQALATFDKITGKRDAARTTVDAPLPVSDPLRAGLKPTPATVIAPSLATVTVPMRARSGVVANVKSVPVGVGEDR